MPEAISASSTTREGRDDPFGKKADPGQQHAEDHRQAAAVHVRHNPGWDFKQEDRPLKNRAEQHDLQRVQSDGFGVKDDVNRHDDLKQQRGYPFEDQVNHQRVETALASIEYAVESHEFPLHTMQRRRSSDLL